MPLAQNSLSEDRVQFYRSLTAAVIAELVANKKLKVLQTPNPVDIRTWRLLNDQFFAVRPDVELRIYGHYEKLCDLTFLEKMGNVRRFEANCLMEATGVESIAHLKKLESLSIGIYGLESFEFLRDLDTTQLTSLSLAATFSKKPSLSIIAHCAGIKQLYIEGHSKDIEVVSNLIRLQDLTLRSVTVPSLAFLRGLTELWSLDIKLGGTKNLDDLSCMPGIKYLELWQIKGLSDLTPIGAMTGLQFLFLQALRNVQQLPNLSRLSALRRICLENMKGLKDLTFLMTAPALEELVHVSAQGREPQQYADLIAKGTLKRLIVGFGSNRKNNELRAMMNKAGVQEYQHSAFSFV